MKKLLTILPALLLAFPAFAFADNHNGRDTSSRSYNRADIQNDVRVNSNTGNNDANRNRNRGRIETGNSLSDALVQTDANSNDTKINQMRRGDDVRSWSRNSARVGNNVEVNSNTGENDANGNGRYWRRSRGTGNGVILTGKAESFGTVTTMVNSNLTRINR